MRIVATAALAFTLSGCMVDGPTQSDADIDAELNRAEQAWAELAMRPDDHGLLDRIIADDFSGQSDDGTVRNKKEEIAYWATQPGSFVAITPAKMTFHHYGDTVIAQGRQTLTQKNGTRLNIVWTDTWLDRGRWQVISSQDAVVAPDDPGDNMG